jgi:ABC-type glycerol-3-phosphate transport system permease component
VSTLQARALRRALPTIRGRFAGIPRVAVLLLTAAVVVYPLLLIVSTALKDPLDVASDPFSLFSGVRLENIADAWTLGGFGHYFWNTVLITVPTVAAVVVLSTLAGYAFAMLEFPCRGLLLYLFLLGLMIPFFSIMIPLYYELRALGLLDHLPAVILPAIAGAAETGLPVGIFLMRAFFQDLPKELGDAARVDGASEWHVFRHVMLPLAAPGAAVLAVLAFLGAWNTFTLPLIYLPGEEHRTLASGLYLFASGRTQETELVAAGTLIMAVPVIVFFLLFQRQFVRGITAGAIKG